MGKKKTKRLGRPPKDPADLGRALNIWAYEPDFSNLAFLVKELECSKSDAARKSIEFYSEHLRKGRYRSARKSVSATTVPKDVQKAIDKAVKAALAKLGKKS